MISAKPRRFLRWGAALCVALIVLAKSCEFVSEMWWFQAEGYARPFAILTAWRWASFVVMAALFGSWLTFTARLAWRTAASSAAPVGLRFREGAQGRLIPLEDKLGLDRYRRRATVIYIVCLSWAAGLAASARFDLWWRAFHAQPTGQTDTLFQRDLAFFLWQLPAQEAITGFVSAALWAGLLLAVAIYIYEEAVEIGGRRITASQGAVRHLGLLLGLILAWKTVGWRVDALDLQSTSGWSGAEYTTHFGLAEKLYALPLYSLMAWISPLGSLLVVYLARRHRGRWCLAAFSLFWLGSWLIGTLVPIWARTSPGVSLDHPLREVLWAAHRKATLESWRLDQVAVINVPEEGTGSTPRVAAPSHDVRITGEQRSRNAAQQAVDQTALWPEDLARAELERRLAARDLSLGNMQLETWHVDGMSRPVYVAVCESRRPGSIGGQSQYYAGIYVMDAVATEPGGTAKIYAAPGAVLKHKLIPSEGEPAITDTDFPLRFGEWSEAAPNQPEAPDRPGDAPSQPRAERSDAPLGGARDLLWNGGDEGVSTHSLLRRAVLALRFGKPALLWQGNGRLIWHRRVAQRCRQIAPILDWGHSDPRLVWSQGKPVWTLTGYAWSRRFPNAAAPPSFADGNYLRAVAIATVDPASGRTRMYAVEPGEPYTALYTRALPGLLEDRRLLPGSIARQLRASMPVMVGQSEIWAAYHPETPREREQRLQQLDGFFSAPWKMALQPPFAGSRYDLSRRALRSSHLPPGEPGKNAWSQSSGVLLSAFAQPTRQNDDTEEFPSLKVTGFLIAQDSAASGTPRLYALRYASPRNIPADWGRIRPVMIVEGRPLPPPLTQINLLPVGRWIVVSRATRSGKPAAPRTTLSPSLPPGSVGTTDLPTLTPGSAGTISTEAPIGLSVKATVLGPEGKPLTPLPTPVATRVAQRLQAAREAWQQARQAQRKGDWMGYTRALNELDKYLNVPPAPAN